MDIITFKDYGVQERFKDLASLFTTNDLTKLLYKVGMRAKINILERTAAGKGADSKLFADYSPRYKLFRRRHGRPVDKVNLFFKGHMLGSMSVKADQNKAIIYFADEEQSDKATHHNYGAPKNKLPKREFFALSISDATEIEKTIDEHIEKALR